MNSNRRTISIKNAVTLITATCLLFSAKAFSQGTVITVDIFIRPPRTTALSYQLGQLNANLGQLNANLGQTLGTTFVVTNLNDNGAGSLRQAILSANFSVGHDTITFDLEGVTNSSLIHEVGFPALEAFHSQGGLILPLSSGELPITDSLTINGPGADRLMVSGQGISRVFKISSTGSPKTVNLLGMTISSGKLLESLGVRAEGGGISASNCVLNLYNAAVTNNEADLGGGIYFEGGILNIARSSIMDNTAARGGGIAVASRDSETYVTNSLVAGNSSEQTGSGILNTGYLAMINSTVTENTSDLGGAAIDNAGKSDLVNGIVSHNTGYGIASLGGNTYLGNSIVARNVSSGMTDISGVVDSLGTNLIGSGTSYCDVTGCYPFRSALGDLVGTPDNPIDPKLGDLEDNGGATLTRALLGGSPAINRANNCVTFTVDNGSCMPYPLTTDQRLSEGFSRMIAGRVDIGSFESHFTNQPTDIDECRNSGWQTFNNPRVFNNQGDCIQFVNTGR